MLTSSELVIKRLLTYLKSPSSFCSCTVRRPVGFLKCVNNTPEKRRYNNKIDGVCNYEKKQTVFQHICSIFSLAFGKKKL